VAGAVTRSTAPRHCDSNSSTAGETLSGAIRSNAIDWSKLEQWIGGGLDWACVWHDGTEEGGSQSRQSTRGEFRYIKYKPTL